MWGLFAQILVFLVPLVGLIFFLGFKLGRRHLLKVQEDMKALELAFNQLLEEMEAVSENNLKVMETMTQDVRELLQVADQKCLYANDLLQELEQARKEARAVLSALPAIPAGAKGIDGRRLQELQSRIESYEERLDLLQQGHGKSKPNSGCSPLSGLPVLKLTLDLSQSTGSSRIPRWSLRPSRKGSPDPNLSRSRGFSRR